METLSIKLSKARREFVEAEAAERGFKSVNAYLDALLRAEQRRKAEEKLLQLVKEADDSGPATPLTKQDWEEIRREGMRRLRKEQSPHGKSRQKSRSSD